MEERKHVIERLMDNTWLLLVLGVVLTCISYTAWGMYEIFSTPAALLP
jgi:hypothetical protein